MDGMLGDPHHKGLSVFEVTSAATLKSRVVGVVYKTAATHRGVMLNRCPWCGEGILWDAAVKP